jgi:hypothetical protein
MHAVYLSGFMICLCGGVAVYLTFVEPLAGTGAAYVGRVAVSVSLMLMVSGLLWWQRRGRGELFLLGATIGMAIVIIMLMLAVR